MFVITAKGVAKHLVQGNLNEKDRRLQKAQDLNTNKNDKQAFKMAQMKSYQTDSLKNETITGVLQRQEQREIEKMKQEKNKEISQLKGSITNYQIDAIGAVEKMPNKDAHKKRIDTMTSILKACEDKDVEILRSVNAAMESAIKNNAGRPSWDATEHYVKVLNLFL